MKLGFRCPECDEEWDEDGDVEPADRSIGIMRSSINVGTEGDVVCPNKECGHVLTQAQIESRIEGALEDRRERQYDPSDDY